MDENEGNEKSSDLQRLVACGLIANGNAVELTNEDKKSPSVAAVLLLRDERDGLRRSIERLVSEKAAMRREINTLQQRVDQYVNALRDAENRYTAENIELVKARREIDALRKQHYQDQADIAELREKCDEKRSDWIDARKSIETMYYFARSNSLQGEPFVGSMEAFIIDTIRKLRERVLELGAVHAKEYGAAALKIAQLERENAEIKEQAEKVAGPVSGIQREYAPRCCYVVRDTRGGGVVFSFIVHDRVTFCNVSGTWNGHSVGPEQRCAVCHPDDEFDIRIGMMLSARRALYWSQVKSWSTAREIRRELGALVYAGFRPRK